MKINKILGGVLMLGWFPLSSHADFGNKNVPVKFASCSHVSIEEPKNSTGYFFDEDCETLFVLPPRLGSLRVMDYRHTIDTNKTCSSISDIEEARKNYDSLAKTLSKRAERYAKKILEIDKMIDDGLVPVGMTLDELYDQQDELMDKNLEIAEKKKKMTQLIVESLQGYAQREGGTGRFILENLYQELIEEYQDLNSGTGLAVRRMPLDQSYLAVVDKTVNSEQDKIEMPALLELLVPSLSQGIRPLSTIATMAIEEADQSAQGQNLVFGDALSGKIRMTAIGSCALERSPSFGGQFQMSDLKKEISANAFYQYQVQVKRHHKITFRMHEFIRKFHEQSRRGGFFSRKTLNKMVDTRRINSWITFHAESEDTRFEYTDEYIKEVKQEFISRALADIVAAKTGNPAAQLALIEPSGKTGAQSIADELQKCPNLYCQIGAAGFRVLDSIFGSSKAASDLTKKFDAEFVEIVDVKKPVEQVGGLTFE